MRLFLACLPLVALLSAAPAAAHSGRMAIEGPVAATVLRVIDGDTVLVRATPWPQHSIDVYVRMRGIDAPELRSRCETERLAARQARDALGHMLPAASAIYLTRISGDKYFGRVLADVHLPDGSDPAGSLLSNGHVKPYQAGRRQKPACF
ncbi:thermonuclease family protein [Rhizobiaceae bacterium BDR2-2]|uniref:Thermonuclease family protein n=1 Tax=Ectorhizobium quercum TaxID=2965071 RepID=A0AAE3N4G3_9HYPH|nr:thermonuclease family protein [Ectorhizobium quercum]MCX8999509.1 thermonuclease family protein [Ectorhizobium quercum]